MINDAMCCLLLSIEASKISLYFMAGLIPEDVGLGPTYLSSVHFAGSVNSVMGSGGADFAVFRRGNRRSSTEDTEYLVILPRLPTGQIVINTVFLHGDVRIRSFRVEDFRDALEEVGMLPAVVAPGAYQINHVWAVTLRSGEATKRLTALKDAGQGTSRHPSTATVPMKPQQHLRAERTVEEKAQAVKMSKTLTGLKKTPP
ncbi:hypothetical protein HPB50_018063 [Hyalomma asiaticum]|uniref:Uncharacterized protein n=1 Tax=Hyalomma asiaticum TaxID=266040 RepID=A0ACB7TLS4_HYAAI|nr:hypothetical protein HPB50_018063 [Hyalomma asiaticum]